jgi:hypothetical protein
VLQSYKASIIVNHSLDECRKQIQSHNKGDLLHSNRVQFWRASEYITDYEVRLWRFGSFLGTVSGDLTFQDSQSTLIACEAQLAARLKIGILVFLCVASIVTLGEILSSQFPFGLIGIPWGVLCWVIWSYMCNQFARSLIKQLEQV